jgi:phage tail tube protein FII
MISLNQQLKRVEIKDFEIENAVVFNYFDNLPATERDSKLLRALYIGVLALMEDRLSSFLSKTSNELGTELESLKMIFDMKKELFYKSSVKGSLAEEEITDFLNNYFSEKKLKDKAVLVRNMPGLFPKNKTGDIICELEGKSDLKIVIECKFDKSIKVGEIESKDVFIKHSDTAWSQLIESQANRDAKVSLIVFDVSLVDITVLKQFDNVGYIPGIGMVAVVNSQKGDYSNLVIAYMLARDIALNATPVELDRDLLAILVNRIIKGLNEVLTIRNLVESNIENNKSILKQLEKSMLLMEFNQHYLKKFLNDGTLTKTDLLNYYNGEDVKDRYRLIEKEINERE